LLIDAWVLLLITCAGNGNSSKTLIDIQLLLMSTVLALNSHFRSSNCSPACIGNDARHYNQLTNEVALQVSEHARILITVNLHLEVRNRVSFLEVLTEIVSLVNLLHCFLELSNF
jgi:hypothetical protein